MKKSIISAFVTLILIIAAIFVVWCLPGKSQGTCYKTVTSFDYSTEGATLNGVYSNDKMEYMSVDILGEMGRKVHQFSYVEDAIIYDYFEIVYAQPYYIDPQNITIKEYNYHKYYFYDGNLYDCKDNEEPMLLPEHKYIEVNAMIEKFISTINKGS